MDLRNRPTGHTPLSQAGRTCCTTLRDSGRSWREGRKRNPEVKANAAEVHREHSSPDSLRLHATTLLVAQSSGDLVLDSRTPTTQAVQLHVCRRLEVAHASFHRVLQRGAREAIPLDIYWKAASVMMTTKLGIA